MSDPKNVELAAELTIAWLSNPSTRATADDVETFLKTMVGSIVGLPSTSAASDAGVPDEYPPAVTVRKSLASREHIISMIDGRPYRTLKRHLATHGLTPDGYRQRYGLKSDYPIVAPGYSEARRETAKRLGLGRKPDDAARKQQEAEPEPVTRKPPQVRKTPAGAKVGGRRKAADAT